MRTKYNQLAVGPICENIVLISVIVAIDIHRTIN